MKTKAKAKLKSKVELKSKSKGLTIDLNEVKNPHPAVLKAYKDSGVQDQFYPIQDEASIINEKRIFNIANAGNANGEKNKIRHKIRSIYRRAVGNKEYCFFHEWLQTVDFFKNTLDHSRVVGKYSYPRIVTSQGINPATLEYGTGQAPMPSALYAQIESVEERYDWSFEEIKPQLLKWYDEGIIDENTNLYAWSGTRKYTVNEWDQFINLNLSDLILINKVGERAIGLYSDPKEILEAARQTAKAELTKTLQKTNPTPIQRHGGKIPTIED